MDRSAPVVLVILDGFGIAPAWGGNAVAMSQAPVLGSLNSISGFSQLSAAGPSVGLDSGQVGNSAAGHNTIGAGRAVIQDSTKVSQLVNQDALKRWPPLLELADRSQTKQVHLIGLLSNSGVHSQINHLIALADVFNHSKVPTFFHLITDGRDSPANHASVLASRLSSAISNKPYLKIASLIGRFWAMDRDRHFDRTARAVDLFTGKISSSRHNSILEALAQAYNLNQNDEYLEPIAIFPLGSSQTKISDGDTVVFFNIRPDRMKQLVRAMLAAQPRANYASLVNYGLDQDKIKTIVETEPIVNSLTEVISKSGFNQYQVAETEKYAHISYFFSGGREDPWPGVVRDLIQSKKKLPRDDPAMQTFKIINYLISAISKNRYKLICGNIAAPDMVGHSGDFKAAVSAIEFLDSALIKLIEAAKKFKNNLVITGDHGNIEQMVDPITGQIDPKHTTNRVPLWLISPDHRVIDLPSAGQLSDVAPTILDLLALNKPSQMTGQSLISKN